MSWAKIAPKWKSLALGEHYIRIFSLHGEKKSRQKALGLLSARRLSLPDTSSEVLL